MSLCKKCPAYSRCGGLVVNGEEDLFGCMHRCQNCHEHNVDCPFACPNNPQRFVRLVYEVGVLDYRPQTQINGPTVVGFPFFAPQIYHASRRFKPLVTDAVTIGIADLLARTKGRKVHDAFCLDPETRVIGLGVAKDHELEKWWGDRNGVVEQLSSMGLDAVTVPNFSIFSNAPMQQSLLSIARLHHFSEALSAAGIATVPHIYAETDVHWERWAEVLKEQPKVTMIAMEFQTGLRIKEKALPYIQRLVDLQERIGRSLHLIAVGGTQHRTDLRTAFRDRLTLTDATSFMKTFRRIKADGPDGDVRFPMERGDDLAELLQINITAREKRLRKGVPVPGPGRETLGSRIAA